MRHQSLVCHSCHVLQPHTCNHPPHVEQHGHANATCQSQWISWEETRASGAQDDRAKQTRVCGGRSAEATRNRQHGRVPRCLALRIAWFASCPWKGIPSAGRSHEIHPQTLLRKEHVEKHGIRGDFGRLDTGLHGRRIRPHSARTSFLAHLVDVRGSDGNSSDRMLGHCTRMWARGFF